MKRNKRWLLLVAIYSSSLLFYLFQGGRSSILLFGILNALLLYLLLYYFLGIRKLTGQRQLGESNQYDQQFMAGQQVQVYVQLQHLSILPISYLQLQDTLVRHDGHVQRIQGIATPNVFREVDLRYTIENVQRGVYRFQNIACSTFDVFGLVEYKRTIENSDSFQVLPRIMNEVNWEQLLSGSKGRYHLHSHDRLAKESNQQSGIRDYVYGDRLSRVHWNATARTGQWKSKEFEKEAMPKGIVILDRYLSKDGMPKDGELIFEELVSIAASLIHYGMEQQQLFALLSPGKELWSSTRFHGTASYWQAMKHLITVVPNSERALSVLLQRAMLELPLGSTLMIVTSDASAEMAAAATVLKQKGFLPIILYSRNSESKSQTALTGQQAFAYAGIPFYDLSSHAAYAKAAGGEG